MQSFVPGSFESLLHEERISLKRSTRQSHSCFQSCLHALDPIFGLAPRCSGLESKALFESYCMFIMLMRLCLEEARRVAFHRYLFRSPVQHGKEGSKEGSCRGPRGPQGDESDEGQKGVEESAIETLLCCVVGNTDCFST
jgi:hypothetical protein